MKFGTPPSSQMSSHISLTTESVRASEVESVLPPDCDANSTIPPIERYTVSEPWETEEIPRTRDESSSRIISISRRATWKVYSSATPAWSTERIVYETLMPLWKIWV